MYYFYCCLILKKHFVTKLFTLIYHPISNLFNMKCVFLRDNIEFKSYLFIVINSGDLFPADKIKFHLMNFLESEWTTVNSVPE